jgi:hypothetical protein
VGAIIGAVLGMCADAARDSLAPLASVGSERDGSASRARSIGSGPRGMLRADGGDYGRPKKTMGDIYWFTRMFFISCSSASQIEMRPGSQGTGP